MKAKSTDSVIFQDQAQPPKNPELPIIQPPSKKPSPTVKELNALKVRMRNLGVTQKAVCKVCGITNTHRGVNSKHIDSKSVALFYEIGKQICDTIEVKQANILLGEDWQKADIGSRNKAALKGLDLVSLEKKFKEVMK